MYESKQCVTELHLWPTIRSLGAYFLVRQFLSNLLRVSKGHYPLWYLLPNQTDRISRFLILIVENIFFDVMGKLLINDYRFCKSKLYTPMHISQHYGYLSRNMEITLS